MKKLIIITNQFPYEKGEEIFILPEIIELQKKFLIEILCISPSTKKIFNTLDTIKVNHYIPKYTLFDKLLNLLKCLFWKEYYKNIFFSKIDLKHWKKRESECRNFYLCGWKFFRFLKNEYLLNNYDLSNTAFYSYWSTYNLLSLVLLKKQCRNIKLLARATGYDLYNERMKGLLQPYKKYMDSYIDGLYFPSKVGLDYYLKNFASSNNYSKYKVAYLGVDNNGESKFLKHNEINIVSCSNIIPLKRINLIIEELSIIKDVKINWIHFGSGYIENDIKEYAFQLLSKDNINYKFFGMTENCKILNYYKTHQVDLFIHLSETEGLPVSIMEAISFGILVVATNAGGTREIVNSSNGLLLDVNFKKGLVAKYIENYSRFDIKKIRELRNNSRNIYLNNFDAAQNYKWLANEFVRVVGKNE